MRVFYLIFAVSVFLLSGLFRSQPEELKAPGGTEFSGDRRVVHYLVVGVIAAVGGWYSVIQLKKDWNSLKTRKNKRDKR
jgi:hypothetical protein